MTIPTRGPYRLPAYQPLNSFDTSQLAFTMIEERALNAIRFVVSIPARALTRLH